MSASSITSKKNPKYELKEYANTYRPTEIPYRRRPIAIPFLLVTFILYEMKKKKYCNIIKTLENFAKKYTIFHPWRKIGFCHVILFPYAGLHFE